MANESTPNPERRRRLEAAMAEYLLAADAGRAPDSSAWLAQYPDLHPELAEFLADMAGLDRLVWPQRPASPPDLAESGRRAAEETAQATPGLIGPNPAGGPEPTRAQIPDPADGSTRPAAADPEAESPAAADLNGDGEPIILPGGLRLRYFGDYELKRVLGRGGMGVVYRARQLSL